MCSTRPSSRAIATSDGSRFWFGRRGQQREYPEKFTVVDGEVESAGAFGAVVSAPAGTLPSAQATCLGAGNRTPIEYYLNGTLRARETADAGTCNADGTYRGNIGDRREDGKCALVKFRDAGVVSTQGTDCSANNGPNGYSFNDRNGDHHAWIKVCIETRCDNVSWIEIWGY